MRWACGNSQYALHRERDTRTMKCEDDNGCCKLPGNLPDKMGERKERKLIINRRRKRRDGTHCVTRLFLGRTRVFVAGWQPSFDKTYLNGLTTDIDVWPRAHNLPSATTLTVMSPFPRGKGKSPGDAQKHSVPTAPHNFLPSSRRMTKSSSLSHFLLHPIDMRFLSCVYPLCICGDVDAS